MKKIGIFQYQWPVKVYTVDLVAKLAESGFQADLYLCGCDISFVHPAVLKSYPNARVFSIFKRDLFSRIVNRIIRISTRMLGLPDRISMEEVVSRTLKNIGSTKYDYFIGIEKNGMIWAGKLSERLGVPYLYYSLELYVDGHPALEIDPSLASIRGDEKRYHAGSTGTIIQDAYRAKVLLESNGIEKTDLIYIPVSVTGGATRKKSDFLHRKLGINASKKIILYIGKICKDRGVNELIKYASQMGNDFVLVLHGPLYPDVITDDDRSGIVYFSTDMIDIKDISKIISSAHVGLAYYGNDNPNNRLTAFSSEKIAYYMQSGLPIIAHLNESYELLMKQHHCGELVEYIHQIPVAVRKIDANYAHYRENAFAAFEHFYSFDNNIRALTEYLLHH